MPAAVCATKFVMAVTEFKAHYGSPLNDLGMESLDLGMEFLNMVCEWKHVDCVVVLIRYWSDRYDQ